MAVEVRLNENNSFPLLYQGIDEVLDWEIKAFLKYDDAGKVFTFPHLVKRMTELGIDIPPEAWDLWRRAVNNICNQQYQQTEKNNVAFQRGL